MDVTSLSTWEVCRHHGSESMSKLSRVKAGNHYRNDPVRVQSTPFLGMRHLHRFPPKALHWPFAFAAVSCSLGRSPTKNCESVHWEQLDGNWISFQLANSTPPQSVIDRAVAPSARIKLANLNYTMQRHPCEVFGLVSMQPTRVASPPSTTTTFKHENSLGHEDPSKNWWKFALVRSHHGNL